MQLMFAIFAKRTLKNHKKSMLHSADVGCIFGDKVVLHFNWVISKQATFAPDFTTFKWFGFETYLKQS